jgi:hypothetical protein
MIDLGGDSGQQLYGVDISGSWWSSSYGYTEWYPVTGIAYATVCVYCNYVTNVRIHNNRSSGAGYVDMTANASNIQVSQNFWMTYASGVTDLDAEAESLWLGPEAFFAATGSPALTTIGVSPNSARTWAFDPGTAERILGAFTVPASWGSPCTVRATAHWCSAGTNPALAAVIQASMITVAAGADVTATGPADLYVVTNDIAQAYGLIQTVSVAWSVTVNSGELVKVTFARSGAAPGGEDTIAGDIYLLGLSIAKV